MLTLARRHTGVEMGDIPPALLTHTWSAFNNLLIWAAAGSAASHPVIDWLAAVLSIENSEIHDEAGAHAASAAVAAGWQEWRRCMRSHSIDSPDDLSQWLEQQGLQAARPHQYIRAEAQEFIINTAINASAQAAWVSSALVQATLVFARNPAFIEEVEANMDLRAARATARSSHTEAPAQSCQSPNAFPALNLLSVRT